MKLEVAGGEGEGGGGVPGGAGGGVRLLRHSEVLGGRGGGRGAGVWKKRSLTERVVPAGRPAGSTRRLLPPAISTSVPDSSSGARVSRVRRETLAMEGR